MASENMNAVINEGFYGFVQHRYRHVAKIPPRKAVSPKVHDIADAYKIIQNLAPVIPKVRKTLAILKVRMDVDNGNIFSYSGRRD